MFDMCMNAVIQYCIDAKTLDVVEFTTQACKSKEKGYYTKYSKKLKFTDYVYRLPDGRKIRECIKG